MKKSFLIATAAIVASGLASCSSDEPVDTAKSGDNAISFRSSMGTRSTEITNANLSEINVAAFLGDSQFFNDTKFTKGSDSYFTSTPEYNWLGDDSELTFFAYAPSNPGGTVTLTPEAKTLTGFSPASNVADQIDFITANATGKKSTNEQTGVPLTFDHRLVQIEVLAKTDNEAYTYEVSGVRVGEPVSKGDFDFTTNDWTLGTEKSIYDETYTTPVKLGSAAQSVMGSEGAVMILPQQLTAWDPTNDASNASQGAYLSIKLKINTVAGAQVYPFPSDADCDWAAIPISTNWEPGKKYIYTLDLTHGAGYVDPHDPDPGKPVLGGPIKFTVDVTEWDNSAIDLPMDTGTDNTESQTAE